MEDPALSGSRAQTGEAMKDMAVTPRKATEKSDRWGIRCPVRAMDSASRADETQIPRDSISCWKVA